MTESVPTPSTESPTPETDDQKMSIRDAAEELRNLFDTLVPPDRVEIRDVHGGVYVVPATLSARAQIVVIQKLKTLGSLLDVDTVRTSGAQGIVDTLIDLASSIEVLDAIGEAFQAAHPAVVGAARRRAVQAHGEATPTDHVLTVAGPPTDVLDLFPTEELVAGLAPFFVRFVARIGNMIASSMAPPAG